VPSAYQDQVLQLVRRRPRSRALPSSRWTRQRRADYLLAEQTGIRGQKATVRARPSQSGRACRESAPTSQQQPGPDPDEAVNNRRWKTPVRG